tara:strand:+ start:360 stop:578 length:219 start_codon:yes stop_codon:yes gene_type:complete
MANLNENEINRLENLLNCFEDDLENGDIFQDDSLRFESNSGWNYYAVKDIILYCEMIVSAHEKGLYTIDSRD